MSGPDTSGGPPSPPPNAPGGQNGAEDRTALIDVASLSLPLPGGQLSVVTADSRNAGPQAAPAGAVGDGLGLPPPPPPLGIVGKVIALLVFLAVVAGAGYWWQTRPAGDDAKKPGAGKGDSAANRPVPVLVAAVEKRDMPVILEGLGSVTPYYTVTVRSQVDGRLNEVRFAEGQTVHKGEILAQIDARPFTIQLHQAEAIHARDAAQLRNSKLNLQRYSQLKSQNLIAVQQFTEQQASVDQLEAQVRADDAAIDSARLMLDYSKITSPIDGVVGVRQVDPGNLVRAADANGLVVVTQVEPIAVMFTLPEDDLPAVRAGMAEGKLVVEVYSRAGDAQLGQGTLEVIDNRIDASTATVRLKAIFANADKALWPNQFVKVRLRVSTRRNASVIPAVAVQRGPKGAYVYAVGKDDAAEVVPVEVEHMQGDDALVKGLAPGQRVVVDGQSRLKPGSKLSIKTGKEGKEGTGPVPAGKGGGDGPGKGRGDGQGKGKPLWYPKAQSPENTGEHPSPTAPLAGEKVPPVPVPGPGSGAATDGQGGTTAGAEQPAKPLWYPKGQKPENKGELPYSPPPQKATP